MGFRINSQLKMSAVILFFAAMLFTFNLFVWLKPKMTMRSDGKTFCYGRAVLYSSLMALAFTFIIVSISVMVDKQYTRKQKLMAQLNATL